jgi:hypothetical protein
MLKYMVISLTLWLIPSVLWAAQTPSHVYQQASVLELKIKALRKAASIGKIAKIPPLQLNKLPIHVYSKSLEVRTKVSRLQKKRGVAPLDLLVLPLRKITPTEVFQSVTDLNTAIDGLLTQKKLSTDQTVTFVDGKTPSNVYEKMWSVSNLLDALSGAINPSYVYAEVVVAVAEIELIAKKMKLSLSPVVNKKLGITPREVNVEGFRNMYRLAKIERRLRMKAVRVGAFPAGKIKPAQVYDTVKNMLAELVRIKLRLRIKELAPKVVLVTGKKPADVLVKMQYFGEIADALAVSNKK